MARTLFERMREAQTDPMTTPPEIEQMAVRISERCSDAISSAIDVDSVPDSVWADLTVKFAEIAEDEARTALRKDR